MPFRCESCAKDFETAEALNSHNADKHAPTSHEAKEMKRKMVEEQRAKEATVAKGSKRKKMLKTYGVLLVIFLALVGGGTYLLGNAPNDQQVQLGPVGGIHIHQDWKFYVDGEALDFGDVRYQVRDPHTHVEGGDGDLLHVHATGVTFGFFLETMGFKLNSTCVTLDDSRELCNSGESTLKFYVNGQPNSEWGNYLLQDLNKVLLSYGNETAEQIQQQIETITDKARTESRVLGPPTHGQ